MKILLDHCVPTPLRKLLAAYSIQIVHDLGWARLRNGELIAIAEQAGFELMITSDKNLSYQQNLAARRLAILVLPTNNWIALKAMATEIEHAVATMRPGEFREL